ncbi:matrin 3-like 1.1 isoform X1 [Alosa sapidissima]|uniref:matrin 3-like 1.1 isoform X1 n=1 Tax=Alosa sapidissima TaxID=34773 RepID=UPI001C09D10A|nr:matrin 3-like 1.1 isoform X1 [Alosa sapidissima]
MSQNHPYRSSRTGYRSQDDFYEDPGSQYTGQRDVYQRPEDLPHPQSYQPSSRDQPSSRAMETHTSLRPDVLNILDSCGLEPSDLSLLAEMPEDLITVETLPHLLKKLRDSKKPGPVPPASASHFTTSAPAPAPLPAYERKRLSTSTEYRPVHSPHPAPASSRNLRETWQDHNLDQRHTSVSAHHSRQGVTSSYAVEYGHSRRKNLHHDHSASYGAEPRQGRISASSRRDIDYRQKPVVDDGEPPYFPKKDVHHTLPSKKEASDFHGRTPSVFPYACQLCNMVVLSNKDWNQHVNTAQHADSQLKLLQRYPAWDCHISSVRSGDDDHPPTRPTAHDRAKTTAHDRAKTTAHDRAKTARPQKRSSQSMEGPPKNEKRPNLKKVKEKPKIVGKVISVKYAAKSIDEEYIRRLLGQFGAIIKIIMFPSLAFVEMGSNDQAGDIEKYFTSNPLEVEGSQVVFTISEAFKFLKSSKVVCFSPLPAGEGLTSELTAIAKRFGPVKNTLFLPSRAYVEMTNAADAEAMVNHHASQPLKLKGTVIQVDYSSEYETLKDCAPEKSTKCKSPEKHTRRSHRSRSQSRSPRRKSRDRKDSKETTHSSQSQKDSKERTHSSSHHRSSSAPKEEKPKGKSQDSPPKPVPRKVSEGKASTDKEGKTSEEVKPPGALEAHNSDSDSDLEGVAVIAEDDEMEGVEILDAVDSDGIEVEEEDDEQVASRDGDQDGEQETEEAEVQEKAAGEVESEPAEEKLPSEGSNRVSRSEKSEACEESTESGALVSSSSKEEHKAQRTAEGSEKGETHSQSEKEVIEVTSGGDQENEELNESTAQDVEDTAGNKEEAPQDMEDGSAEMEQVADEEEEFDFPESLENLITLDEIDDEDSSDEQDAKKSQSSVLDQRVICLRNLPQAYYTDEEFWKIGKRYGKVARYFLIRNRCEGFIEMENGDDAKKAVSDLTRRKFIFHNYALEVALSWKYKKLVNAWVPEPEKKDKHQCSKSSESRERSRSRSSSKSKSQSKQSPTESKDKKSDQNKKLREDSEASAEKPSETSKNQEKSSPNKDSSQKAGEESQSPVREESVSTDKAATNKETTVAQPIKAKQDEDDGLSQYQPNNPVGQEFVRPVVGYFCNLCNIIYATEEEAKNEHCSSLPHFQKFKEHLEKTKT